MKVDGRRVFRHVKKKDNKTQVFTNEEVRKIDEFVWKDTENPFCSRVYLLAPLGVLFMLKTGVRVGEMLAACHEDISEDGKWIHIQRQYRYETDEIADYTKGAENDRYVPLPEGARKTIDAAIAKKRELGLEIGGIIFSVDGKPMPYAAVRYQFLKYWRCIIKMESINAQNRCYNSRERMVRYELRQRVQVFMILILLLPNIK